MNKRYSVNINGIHQRVCVTDDINKILISKGESIDEIGNKRVRRGESIRQDAQVEHTTIKSKIPWGWLAAGATGAASVGYYFFQG